MLNYENQTRTMSNDDCVEELLLTLESEHYYASEWPSHKELLDPLRKEALAGLEAYIKYFRRATNRVIKPSDELPF